MPDCHPDHDLLAELEPVAEQLLNRHLAMAKEWLPHQYVPWSLGRDLYDSYHGRLKPEPTTGTDQLPVSQPRPAEPGEQPSPDVTPTAHR